MSDIEDLATELLSAFQARGLKLATAESCTGGMLGATITEISGASDVFDRGFITYSNEAKTEMLNVTSETLAAHGAVSEQTACEMAVGALAHSHADIAVSVTGIAGPGGGTAGKPVGLVWFGLAGKQREATAVKRIFSGMTRTAVRRESARVALELARDAAYATRP
ncbi:CinA family protein [Chelativorans sp. YIM 93263]|uniref:CinA family protein n=1 Tax=Chelativorans sp. YIM 93263 TaxID=2906648 RepID=UPI002379B369|nr:CinA family protein [Chelativorans sp. YIM 93263]